MNVTRKKVLLVLEAIVGGTRRHLLSLAANLNSEQFQVEVAAPRIRHTSIDDTSFEQELRSLGIPHHIVDMAREIHPPSDLRNFWQLTRLIHQNKYDLIHAHSSKAGFLGRIAAKLNRVPVVYTPHGFYFLDASNPTKEKFYLLLEQAAGKFTDKLIAVSQGEGDQAVKRNVISPQKLAVIPNGIRIQDFEPNCAARRGTKAMLGIPPDSPVVGTVSRYIPQKNPLSLVHTFAHIQQAMPQVRFLWCGEGEMRAETEQLAKELGVFHSISFLGFQENIKDIMNTFDVFVLASVFEGLPYTILEAMALGLPVVATNVVGSRDVVQHEKTGFLVECSPNQSHDLAESIIYLLRDEAKKAELGNQGQQLVREKFSIEQMVRQTQKLYIEMIG